MKKKIVGMLLASVLCMSLMACEAEEPEVVEVSVESTTADTTQAIPETNATESSVEETEASTTEETETTAESTVETAEGELSEVGKVYVQYVGEYSMADNDNGNSGYLTVAMSPDVISLRLDVAGAWTETENWEVQEDGTLLVSCEYYLTEAEPDDLLIFELKAENDGITMTITESDCPLYEVGDTFFFTEL